MRRAVRRMLLLSTAHAQVLSPKTPVGTQRHLIIAIAITIIIITITMSNHHHRQTSPSPSHHHTPLAISDLAMCLELSVYMDDPVVFSTTLDEHVGHLDAVMNRLRNANIKAHPQKSCLFLEGPRFI